MNNILVKEIVGDKPELSDLWSRVALKNKQCGENRWEKTVSPVAAQWVRGKAAFGYKL